jgi:nucleotide-binding universal stress UspA family protein
MFKSVLLPIDLNHPASWEKALPMARDLVAPDGTLHILGIVHDIGSAMVASVLPEHFVEHQLEQMKAALDTFATDNVGKSTPCQTHVGHGHVPETVLHVASDTMADLIVMASHPPDDLRSLLVGSYADKVVRHATIPVLTVR